MESVASSVPLISGREKIARLQAALIARKPTLQLKVVTYNIPGVHARELHIPAGCCLVGRVHLQPQINVITKGRITIFTEDGKIEVKAGDPPIVSKAGTQRAGYAHEDTIWTTFLATDLTDADEIYEKLTTGSVEEYEKIVQQKKLVGE